MLGAFIISTLFLGVLSSVSGPLTCIPESFEGSLVHLETVAFATFQVDYTLGLMAIQEKEVNVLINQTSGVTYVRGKNTCTLIMQTDDRMPKRCLTQLEASFHLGSPTASFDTETFAYENTDGHYEVIMLSKTDHVPIMRGSYIHKRGEDVIVYFNITMGISDPSVFQMPTDDCKLPVV